MGILVVNRHKYDGDGVYLGRGTALGNKYVIGKDGDRGQVIELYRAWLREQYRRGGAAKKMLLELVARYKRGEHLVLICSCKPLACHVDVIADAIVKICAK